MRSSAGREEDPMRAISFAMVIVVVACGGGESPPPDVPPDPTRTCTESITTTTPNQPPCTWEWTCSDFSGTVPQFAADCVAGIGGNVTCQCRESGRGQTGTMTLLDGCISFVDACAAANADCGFSVAIACPQQ
jgi:hypothetical protein